MLLVVTAHGLRERAAAVRARIERAARERVRAQRLLVRTHLIALACRQLARGLLRWHNCDERTARLTLRWLLLFSERRAHTTQVLHVARGAVWAKGFSLYS